SVAPDDALSLEDAAVDAALPVPDALLDDVAWPPPTPPAFAAGAPKRTSASPALPHAAAERTRAKPTKTIRVVISILSRSAAILLMGMLRGSDPKRKRAPSEGRITLASAVTRKKTARPKRGHARRRPLPSESRTCSARQVDARGPAEARLDSSR